MAAQNRRAAKAKARSSRGTQSSTRTSNGRSQRSSRTTGSQRGRVSDSLAGRSVSMSSLAVPRRARRINLFDATFDRCLGLPRPVAPYTIVRTNTQFESSSRIAIFTTAMKDDSRVRKWTDLVALTDVNGAAAINAANNTELHYASTLDSLAGDVGEMVPASMTVRVMNGEALQTTSGMIFMGRSPTSLSLGGATITWDDLGDRLIQVGKPKNISAARLALAPQKASAVPMNMNDLSEFSEIYKSTDIGSPHTFDINLIEPTGLSPLWVVNPSSVSLTYLVTVQWRIRLDVGNPMAGAHTYHPPSAPSEWGSSFEEGLAGGEVWNIAETVAEGLI